MNHNWRYIFPKKLLLRAYSTLNRASDISRKKKAKFAEKSADFAGGKSKFAENQPISRDFNEKSQISKDFEGQVLRKIGRFHGKFRGETLPRNNQ